MKKIMNKRGVLGLNTAVAFILVLLTLVLVIFAAIVAISALRNNTTILPTNSLEANATTAVFNNFSQGVGNFMGNSSTWFAVLGVVITLLILGLIIYAVRRFSGAGMGGGVSG